MPTNTHLTLLPNGAHGRCLSHRQSRYYILTARVTPMSETLNPIAPASPHAATIIIQPSQGPVVNRCPPVCSHERRAADTCEEGVTHVQLP